MDNEINKFWRDEEKKLGQEICGRALGRILCVNHTGTEHPWALFFTTASTLYVKTFPSQNWLLRLLNAKETQPTPDYEFIIPGDSLLHKEFFPAYKSLLQTQLPRIKLSWKDENGEELGFVFEVEEGAEVFYKTIPGTSDSSEEASSG